jgi:hypothetical protein
MRAMSNSRAEGEPHMPDLTFLAAVTRTRRFFDDMLFRYVNVVGVGAGFRRVGGEWTDELAVQVYVSRKYPAAVLGYENTIPPFLPGPDGMSIRTDVIDTGFIRSAQDTATYRPLQGGCSIGGLDAFGAGTLGGWAIDSTDQSVVLVTCNHVLCQDSTTIPADPRVTQPAPLDGGSASQDTIGTIKRILPIPVQAGSGPIPTTPADCGIVSPAVPFYADILQIGPGIYGVQPPQLGDTVQKRGRTTELTSNGKIMGLDINYTAKFGPTQQAASARIGGPGSGAFLIDSTDGNPFAADGDSGSVVFSTTSIGSALPGDPPVDIYQAIGLLSGLSSSDSTMVFACSMDTVFSQLHIESLCSGVASQILKSIGADYVVSTGGISGKARQLRDLRDTIFPRTPGGQSLAVLLAAKAATWSTIWLTDETARGLTVRAFRDWICAPSNFELLERIVTAEDVAATSRLFGYLGGAHPAEAAVFGGLQALIASAEGRTLGDLLRTAAPPALDGNQDERP